MTSDEKGFSTSPLSEGVPHNEHAALVMTFAGRRSETIREVDGSHAENV